MLSIAYVVGFVSGVKKYFPFALARSISEEFSKPVAERVAGWDSCEVEELLELPPTSTVIVGHAYGSPSQSTINDFIAPNVERFLLKNNQKINDIIFTGDVFNVPSSFKWNRLFEKFDSAKIYIAPGNHDILRPDSKEVFLKNNRIRKDFPFYLSTYGDVSLVLDDSITSNWSVSDDLKMLIKNIPNENIFIARHNIPISQLLPYANSLAENLNIPEVDDFIQGFSKKQNFTWLMGDGGASESLPRLTCNSFKNHRFIVNGIGEVKNDTVLVLYEGKIFSHIIH